MTSVKKVLGCLNNLTQEAKLDTVEKVRLFLTENLEGVDGERLNSLMLQFKDTVSSEGDLFVTTKTKTRPRNQREITKYNLFVKETMKRLKSENPDTKNTELMKMSADAWNEHKKLEKESEVVADVVHDVATPVVEPEVESSSKKTTKKTKK